MIFPCVVALVLVVTQASTIDKQCLRKEKSLAALELAKYSLNNARNRLPECDKGNTTGCGKKEQAAAYIEEALDLIDQAKKLYPEIDLDVIPEPEPEPTTTPEPEPLPSDCLDVMQSGKTESGVYLIRLAMPEAKNKVTSVYCDMKTDGGGWTVVQRRDNYTEQENFYRDWIDYRRGFGNLQQDFWAGNDNIYYLSNVGETEVRFDLQSQDLESRYAYFSSFRIENEEHQYKLHISGYSGNAGNSLKVHDQQFFSTWDRKNDNFVNNHCAEQERGGWWFNNCGSCNLNGLYSRTKKCDGHKYLYYYMWRECEPLKFTEIKIRRKQ